MRFVGTAYRAHDPRWSFRPTSGEGAAAKGGRFNPRGVPALYLSLTAIGAVREANQGLAFHIDPCVLCSYAVDCNGLVDVRTADGRAEGGVSEADMAAGWLTLAQAGRTPPTWAMARRLIAAGRSGVVAPSYAPGATEADANLVLWRWGAEGDCRVAVHDPDGRLPRDAGSWG